MTTTTAMDRVMSPRVLALLEREGVIYLGPVIVQSPGAWTRVGPTWIIPGIGWLTLGPGAANWGTEAGLADLAMSTQSKPKWHAVGASISPSPNIAYLVVDDVLQAEHMREVRRLTELVP